MTPRSRCPIIINSTTSLSAVEEEQKSNLISRQEVFQSPSVIMNPSAHSTSPAHISPRPLADVTNTRMADNSLPVIYKESPDVGSRPLSKSCTSLLKESVSSGSLVDDISTSKDANIGSSTTSLKQSLDFSSLKRRFSIKRSSKRDVRSNNDDLQNAKSNSLSVLPTFSSENLSYKKAASLENLDGEPKTKSSSSLRRTLSSASSASSLFGNFFRQLSTSSLVQLASKLSSSNSSAHLANADTVSSPIPELPEPHDEFNDSLSSVFKDYLLHRSILTDNPVDLSMMPAIPTQILDEDTDTEDSLIDSAYEGSQPSSSSLSRDESKGSLRSRESSLDICKENVLSDSLLFCLDGGNPQSSDKSSTEQEKTPVQSDEFGSCKIQFYSCSPNGRSKSIKNRKGTPVARRERESSDSPQISQGILFETSF